MNMPKSCARCDSTGWICEAHDHLPSECSAESPLETYLRSIVLRRNASTLSDLMPPRRLVDGQWVEVTVPCAPGRTPMDEPVVFYLYRIRPPRKERRDAEK